MRENIKEIINQALDEDLGKEGDITSNLTIPKNHNIKFNISNREEIILCGIEIAMEIFALTAQKLQIDEVIDLKCHFADGDLIVKNSTIISGFGNARVVFAAERLVLNLMQHLSGIATTTNQYVKEIKNNKTQILDTRKTIPLLRNLQKYAVKIGGGKNHRFALYDGILIKDNHIAAAGGVLKAIEMVRNNLADQKMPIEIECDNLVQVKEAIEAKADIIMLDNMDLEQIKEAVKVIDGKAKIEVSGGMSLDRIGEIADIGVDYISVGGLTHNVRSVDIGLDVKISGK